MQYNFIVIEGNIGAGKTTLTTKIAEDYNAKIILEQFADNPFLPKFYKNQERYAFPLEMSFLADRYNQLKKELTNRDLFKTFTISDYYFIKSLIFAKSTLHDDEYKLYRDFFNIIYTSLPKPDIYVYLHKDVDVLLANIKKRGRDYEQEIEPEYLQKIQNAYFDFFKQENNFSILILDTNKINFVESEADYKKVLEVIFKGNYPKGITRVEL